MTKLETIPTHQLARATGGFDVGGALDMIGNLAGSFDKSGKAQQIIGAISPVIQQLIGSFGGQPSDRQQATPQAGAAQEQG